MAEIKHDLLSGYLSSLTPDTTPPIFFIWGEEFICRKLFDAVIEFLLPGDSKELGYELLEGEEAVVPVIMERICTYSVFQERRVVAIKNAPLFPSPGASAAAGFLKHDIENLVKLIEKGFPENHYLVVTSLSADKRRTLFNVMKSSGVAIDCTVPQGSGKADREAQAELLHLTMKAVLDRTGKGITGDAFQALTDMTGFDPVALNDNLERLTVFIGSRDVITLKDVSSVVRRTRKDAIFELTNAVGQRDLEASLFYYRSLCDSGFHPLQLLASLVNQMRKIFVAKIFIVNQVESHNSCWRSNQSYQQFTTTTMPFVTRADLELQKTLSQWGDDLGSRVAKLSEPDLKRDGDKGESDLKSDRGRKKGSPSRKSPNEKRSATDLTIAFNSKSSYPVYQTFLKSEKFGLNELASIMAELSDMDYRFKSSSDGDQAIVLEELIIRICTSNIEKKMEI